MTLNKTESLRLYSNNDISSQSQVNIMPKRKRDRISDPAKNKQSLPTCIIRVTSLSDHGRFTTRSQVSDTLQHPYARYATYVSDSGFIPHIVCNQLRPDPNNSPRLSGKYGYHRQCYLRYTGNLIHLEDGTKKWVYFNIID